MKSFGNMHGCVRDCAWGVAHARGPLGPLSVEHVLKLEFLRPFSHIANTLLFKAYFWTCWQEDFFDRSFQQQSKELETSQKSDPPVVISSADPKRMPGCYLGHFPTSTCFQ